MNETEQSTGETDNKMGQSSFETEGEMEEKEPDKAVSHGRKEASSPPQVSWTVAQHRSHFSTGLKASCSNFTKTKAADIGEWHKSLFFLYLVLLMD